MRRVKKLIVFMLLSLFILSIPCEAVEAKAKISKKKVTMNVGDSQTLSITGTKKKITWSTSDSSIVTVSATGTIYAKAGGQAIVSAKVGKKTLKCKVKVKKPEIFDPAEIIKKLEVDSTSYLKCQVLKIKNPTKYNVFLAIRHKLYDSAGVLLNSNETFQYSAVGIPAGESVFIYMPFGYGAKKVEYNIIYKTIKEYNPSNYSYDVTYKYEKGQGYLVTNNAATKSPEFEVFALYKKNGKVVDIQFTYWLPIPAGETVRNSIFGTDEAYDTREIIIRPAYSVPYDAYQ